MHEHICVVQDMNGDQVIATQIELKYRYRGEDVLPLRHADSLNMLKVWT